MENSSKALAGSMCLAEGKDLIITLKFPSVVRWLPGGMWLIDWSQISPSHTLSEIFRSFQNKKHKQEEGGREKSQQERKWRWKRKTPLTN